ncbi:50S ribosomal protein L25 [Opitutales bacterium]|nr:50S ribosomal protein L25 [Opitutales bacterium]MDA8806382.1 50S ribosomal protein L25 [Opitutales bacterium]
MSNITETILKVDSRVKHGTSLSKKLRSQGRIPAVFYGKDILKHYSVDDSKFRALMRSSGGTLSLIELQEDSGDKELALLKDIQIDSVKDNILHLDFVQVTRGQTLETKIPLELVGESIGVKSMGGILEFHQSEILVRCRPSQLPKGLELDISGLDLGDSLQIRNLPVIEGVEYVADPEGNIVTCVSSASGRAGADDETDEGASGEPSSQGDDSVTPDSGSNAEGSE